MKKILNGLIQNLPEVTGVLLLASVGCASDLILCTINSLDMLALSGRGQPGNITDPAYIPWKGERKGIFVLGQDLIIH